MRKSTFWIPLCLVALSCCVAQSQEFAGAETLSFYGYDDCIELTNSKVTVTLCPAAGGRVLRYALGDKNVLYLPRGNEGWRWDGTGKRRTLNAGRFDIGPEKIVPKQRHLLSYGAWVGEIIGPRKAQMTSQKDVATGVQLVRVFELAADTSQLKCTQIIRNISGSTKEYCHWSRTFAVGGGYCIIPTSVNSRFPNHYVMYASAAIGFAPQDPNVVLSPGYLRINGAPANPKLGMDSDAGRIIYHAPNDLLFVKHFQVDRDRVYSEIAGLTISIWYPQAGGMVELEPIGPRETLRPGEAASFTETWFLLNRSYHKGQNPWSATEDMLLQLELVGETESLSR